MNIKNYNSFVGLITIWYKSNRSEIEEFLNSVDKLNYCLKHVFIILDQSQEDLKMLTQNIPNLKIFYVNENIGSAASWNIGLNYLLKNKFEYIGIWNADIKVAPDCIIRLVDIMEKDITIGAAGPIIMYSDEPFKVQMFGGSYNISKGLGSHNYNGFTDLNKLPNIINVQYIDGGTILIRASIIKKIGKFDEKLFLYCEDTDISLRIQKAGYKTVVVRNAKSWHTHREKTGIYPRPYEIFYSKRNRFYIAKKHGSYSDVQNIFIYGLCGLLRDWIFFLRRRKWVLQKAYLMGTLYGCLGKMGKRGWVN
jgi:GT2 family glycosyltransferase